MSFVSSGVLRSQMFPMDPKRGATSHPTTTETWVRESAMETMTVFAGVANLSDMLSNPWGCMNGNGVFYVRSRTRFGDVTDGLSNTIFVSEVPDSGGDAMGGFSAGADRKAMFSGGADSNPPTEMTEFLIAAESNDPSTVVLKSSWKLARVTGGAHFLMGDGSIQFFSENMDMRTYQAVSTRNGGETADFMQ